MKATLGVCALLVAALQLSLVSAQCSGISSCTDCTRAACRWCQPNVGAGTCTLLSSSCGSSPTYAGVVLCPCTLRNNCTQCYDTTVGNPSCTYCGTPQTGGICQSSSSCTSGRVRATNTCQVPPPPPCDFECRTGIPDWALGLALGGAGILALGVLGMVCLCYARCRNATMSTENKEVPPTAQQLLNISNTSKAPVIWVGRPQIGAAPFGWFFGLIVLPVAAMIVPLTAPYVYLMGVIILPWIYSLIAMGFFYCRSLPQYKSTIYVLTTDHAYIMTTATECCNCCNSNLSLAGKYDIMGLFNDPTVQSLRSDGVGSVLFGFGSIVSRGGITNYGLGFINIKDAAGVCERIRGLRKDFFEKNPNSRPENKINQAGGAGLFGLFGAQRYKPQEVVVQMQPQGQQPKFDPYTGKPLQPELPPGAMFDPFTGKPLNQGNQGGQQQPSYNPGGEGQAPPAYDAGNNNNNTGFNASAPPRGDSIVSPSFASDPSKTYSHTGM